MTAGTAADPTSSDAVSPLPIWRRFTNSFGRGLDALIDGVLQDNDVVVVEKPPCFAKDERVLPHTTTFRARNRVLVPAIRRAFALLCVVGMVAWLLVDILYQDANGLVPGLRDTYVIDSKPFNPNEQQQQDNSTTSVCTCTYSAASSTYGQPPYTSLVLNNGHSPPTFKTLLAYCDEPPGGARLLNNRSAAAGQLISNALEEFLFHLADLRIEAPTSAIMLPKEGWKAARMAEAQKYIHSGLSRARYRLQSAPASVSNEQIETGLQYIALLHAAFSKALGRMLDMPDYSTTAEMVNQAANTSVSLSCANVPSRDGLPLALGEWCVPVSGQPGTTADTGDNERDCSDPYVAYVQRCAPAVCHTLGPKSHYLQAVQIMSAIGGVYSIIAMFAFAIVWRAFCSLERQVDLDGLCLTNCSRLRACWPRAATLAHRVCCCCNPQRLQGLVGGSNPPLPLSPQQQQRQQQQQATAKLNAAVHAAPDSSPHLDV